MKKLLFLLCVLATTVFAQESTTIKYGGSGPNINSIFGRILVGIGESKYVLATTDCTLDVGTDPPTFLCGGGGGGGGGAGHVIQEEGAPLPTELALNFIGPAVTALDDAANGRTNVLVGIATQEEGAVLPTEAGINFIGSLVTCADDPAGTRINCTFLVGCPGNDQLSVGSGTNGVCTTLPNCNPASEIDHYNRTTNQWECININSMLSENGGTTPWDYSRHLMFAQPSGTVGDLFYNGITLGEGGLGTAIASPTTISTVVALRRCATTVNAQCGWAGAGNLNAHGVLKWRHDYAWKLYYTSSFVGDDILMRLMVGFGGVGTIDTIPCNLSWSNPSTGYWFCFEKSLGVNWLACSGNGTTGSCEDTGAAAAPSGSVWTMRIDSRDMASVKYYINGVLRVTRTANLPASTSIVNVGRIAMIHTTGTTTQVQMGVSFIRSTWD